MIDFLQSRPKPSVVGVHASLLSRPMNSYARDRRVADRMAEVRRPWQVDVLGTDSALFDSATLTPDVRAWRYLNMVDLQFALDAARQGLERVIIPRPKRWLTSLAHDQPDSIFVKLQRDDSIQTQLARELLELDTGRQSEAAADFR